MVRGCKAVRAKYIYSEEDKKVSISICVIGCGGIASSVHGPSYIKYKKQNGLLELAACCDTDMKKAEEFKIKFGFKRSYDDYKKMLENEKPSAVCVIVTEKAIAEIASTVLEMGYPVFMEKPPGRNTAEINKIMDAAKKGDTPNQVAFNRRYIPLVRELKARLKREYEPSDIQNIRYDFFRVDRRDYDFSETAIHGIDTVRYLAGSDYSYIRFHYQEFPELGENVANIYMDCDFKSGATAQLSFCPVAGTIIERATVNLYDNTYFLDIPIWSAMDCPGRLLHVKGGKIISDVSGKEISDGKEMFEESGFYAENKSFFDDISMGKYPENNITTAVQSVEIADCIRKRIKEYKF